MRYFVIFFMFLSCGFIQAQETKHETVLEAPDTWRPEIISMPLAFAPSLDYTGFEDIRFSKGWADTTATDYFTYTFTWVLDKNPKLDKETLETQMKAYFDGLMVAVAERNDIPKSTARIYFDGGTQAIGGSGQINFYEAFFKKAPITLNIRLTGGHCSELDKYLVRFELSPQPIKDPLWQKFKEVKLTLDCGQH